MKKTTIKKCEEKLLKMQTELLKTLQGKAREELAVDTNVQDEGDIAQDSSAKALAMTLADNSSARLKMIEGALNRIKDGTFGYCIDTEEEIEEKRLLANPLALRTIEAQESFERESKRVNSGGGVSVNPKKMFGSDDD